MPKSTFDPCIPTRGTKVPGRPEWIHEIKHDGYRLIVQRDGSVVRLWTRNGHDWSHRFPLIREGLLLLFLESSLIGTSGSRTRCDFAPGRPGGLE